jgi:hypothetical protein
MQCSNAKMYLYINSFVFILTFIHQYMYTYIRVHTTLAALAATKLNLLNKLALIDSELEVKKVKLNKSHAKK